MGDRDTYSMSSPTPAISSYGAFFKINEDAKAYYGINLLPTFFYSIPLKKRFASFDISKASKSIYWLQILLATYLVKFEVKGSLPVSIS